VVWNFGDGTSSAVWSPSHVYAQSGVYRICLKITVNNTCISDTCQTISVVVPPTSCSWQAAFTTRVSTANVRNIIFQNNTTAVSPNNATATWSFGDGSTANSWNAEHLYTQPGRYLACLTVVTSDSCVKTRCDTIVVAGTAISCDSARVSFFYRRDNYMLNKLYFFAQSNVGILQQQWSFKRIGDTGTSVFVNQFNPTHVFSDTGRYQVCLRAILPNGCVKETCNTVNIYSTVAPSQCFLQAYPNPARNNVYFNLHLTQPQYINVYVYNAQNMLVRAQVIQGFTGNNNIHLNIGSLPNGFYNVRIVYGNAFCYSRFQKF
jgi:PKD repeat protein